MLEVCYIIPKTNVGALVVSVVTIVCLILAKELNAYLSKKIPVPIPVELLAVSTEALRHLLRCQQTAPIYDLSSVNPDYHRHGDLLASEFERAVWSGCGGEDSLRVRSTHFKEYL